MVAKPQVDIGEYQYGFRDEEDYVFKSERGLTRDTVEEISAMKDEPDWMRDFRLKALEHFQKRPMPNWGARSLRDRFRRHLLLHPARREAGQDLGRGPGVHQEHLREARHPRGGAQVPGRRRRAVRERSHLPLAARGPREAGRDLPRHGFRRARAPGAGQEVLRHDHPVQRQQVRRAQLGGLVGWLVHLRAARSPDRRAAAGLLPHQRREHGPVRADADHRRQGRVRALRRRVHRADLHHEQPALGGGRDHRAEGGRCRYTTIQNWSKNVYNLVTKRAAAYKNATMEWVDGNLGSKVTMKYPAVWLMEEGARGEILSVAFASDGQHQDAGGKVVHVAPRHVVADHLEVDLEGDRPLVLPRSGEGLQGRRGRPQQRRL